MVTFVTLFLSLLSGTHEVQVAVDGPVSSVVVLVDQRVIGELTGPPWMIRCDFGEELKPHELVAVAYDAVYGARPVKRYLQKKVETELGRLLIRGDAELASAESS